MICKNTYSLLAGVAFIGAASLSAQTTYNWDGGGTNDRFGNAGNWTPTGGPPGSVDTGNVGGTFRVEVGTLSEMDVGATINMNNSSFLERSTTSSMQVSGELNFNDSSDLRASIFELQPNAVLNWNSTGSFVDVGSTTQSQYQTKAGSVTNLSSGEWILAGGTTAQVSLLMFEGTFNADGGRLTMGDRLRVGQGGVATFNIGTGAEIYADGVFMNATGSLLNFDSGASIAFVGTNGISTGGFSVRLADGFVGIDGTVTTSASDFTTEEITGDFGVGTLTYTRITAIPEPSSYALILGVVALGGLAGRGIRRNS